MSIISLDKYDYLDENSVRFAVLPKKDHRKVVPVCFQTTEIGCKSLVCYVDSEIGNDSREGWVGKWWNHSLRSKIAAIETLSKIPSAPMRWHYLQNADFRFFQVRPSASILAMASNANGVLQAVPPISTVTFPNPIAMVLA